MKAQLSLLLISIQSQLLTLISICFAFFLPISGILLMIGVLICIDTMTGIWKAKKLGIPITSRGLSAIVSKLFLYEVAVIGFYLIDYYILNDILLQFFSVPLMLTKILSLVLCSIEVISISENYKAVKGIDIWSAFKNLLQRSKEIKKDIDGVRYNNDSTTPSI